MRRDGIGARIAIAAFAVAAVALVIVAIGVLKVGSDEFAALMAAAGHSAEEARLMFDQSVSVVVLLAAIVAIMAAVLVATVLARRIARPIERLSQVAAKTADGDLLTMVPDDGPAEVRELAHAYNVLVDRLAEQESVRREFVVNASHELRTPLTNLQGYLEALRDGVLPPDPATFDSLREEVDRLGRLAASLDLLAGGTADRPMPEDLDLGAVVRTATDVAMAAFQRRSVDVSVTIPDVRIVVHARSDELVQVLSNLLQNAARYTPSGGSVGVAVALADGEAIVRISNSGPPIPEADLPRVWERFYRVEKSRDRTTGGAGIGLAIVKRLVEDAGGRVGASSEPGRTTFWFALRAA
ncbi:MAG TPA: HAMP domain-containing sensor histidine kinase [Candidatus Limnocylindrales bacterium]|nr:HAMP domain-containing sensor histidine kinase [Candidatus Limnocylindrales bacterium]